MSSLKHIRVAAGLVCSGVMVRRLFAGSTRVGVSCGSRWSAHKTSHAASPEGGVNAEERAKTRRNSDVLQ